MGRGANVHGMHFHWGAANLLHPFILAEGGAANVHPCQSFGGQMPSHANFHGLANVRGGGEMRGLLYVHLHHAIVKMYT